MAEFQREIDAHTFGLVIKMTEAYLAKLEACKQSVTGEQQEALNNLIAEQNARLEQLRTKQAQIDKTTGQE